MTLPGRRAVAPLTLASLLLLAACGGGGSGDDEHEHTHIDSAGRLALIEDGSNSVRIYDLDDKAVLASFAVDHPPSAIHASPGRRHAVVIQRTQDLVQFVDGGLWQEDHVDHLHDYKESPRLLGFRLEGPRPTHYEAHEGLAALFFDGLAATGLSSGVALLSDASLGSAQGTVATLPLGTWMHGTAEPRGEFLLATYRVAEAAGTLPEQVDLYRRSGSGYEFVRRFDESCPSLHGSFSNERHTAFGCADGVLVVTQSGNDFTARKIANPPELSGDLRIGTLTGHDRLGSFVGIASTGLLFDVDPVAGTITPIAWAEGRTRRAHGFDASGERFLVLDETGTLHLLDATAGWTVQAAIPVVGSMPGAAPFPSIAFSSAGELAYVNDPAARDLAVIDLHGASIRERLPLDFRATGIVWLGIEAHGEHAH